MPPHSLLMRVMLCVVLLINGTSLAAAGTQMHMQHVSAGLMGATSASPSAHSDCPEHLSTEAPVPTESDLATADCCNDAVCAFVCAAGAASTLPPAMQGLRISSQAMVVRPARTERPEPVLQVRYRPPII